MINKTARFEVGKLTFRVFQEDGYLRNDFRGKVSRDFAGERFQQASMVKICYQ
jgi:hypothetical protein